jgi:2-keto-4-pentenoate hydratase/2-oxohepta-3-ene-1,7-dioic acid hydratase in catechol pathway
MFKRDINWTKGKGMDNAAPMGPCIVTSDEIKDPFKPPLRLKTRVNGQERQNNTLDNMIVRIPRIIEYLSNGTTLMPGDVIATGTVAGVAHSWGPEGFLKVGDVVECEIQPIGILKHDVVAES